MQKEDTSSTTAYLESIILTSVIYAKEDSDVVSIDITNFFIQKLRDRKPGKEKIRIKIKGVLVDILVHIDPGEYCTNVVYERGHNVLYLEVLKAIYGMLQSALLSYINLRKYFQTDGFKFKLYHPRVFNKII